MEAGKVTANGEEPRQTREGTRASMALFAIIDLAADIAFRKRKQVLVLEPVDTRPWRS